MSEHPNYVTAQGLALIEAELARLHREHAAALKAEDRAAQAKSTLSHVSPLARALMGKRVGDVVLAGQDEAEILAIR